MPYFEQGFALIIGVGGYTDLRDLPATTNDARAIQDVLLDPNQCAYNPRNVLTLYGKAATRYAILDALEQLNAITTDDSTVVVYFSGHGGQWNVTSFCFDYCGKETQKA